MSGGGGGGGGGGALAIGYSCRRSEVFLVSTRSTEDCSIGAGVYGHTAYLVACVFMLCTDGCWSPSRYS